MILLLVVALAIGTRSLIAQGPEASPDSRSEETSSEVASAISLSRPGHPESIHPFTFGASMESVSTLGVQIQIATNLNRRVNLRSNYGWLIWKKWVSSEGFATHATAEMLSTNISLDFYPFPSHGLRLSPGVLVHNAQVAGGLIPLAPVEGGKFTVNGHTYYSAPANITYDARVDPEDQGRANAYEAVHLPRTAFTMTAGWGNMISRHKVGRWSFPIELGVAFLGSPAMNLELTYGEVCDANGKNCAPARENQQLQHDLQAHFSPYKSHLNLLKTYPIVSFGMAYSFDLRSARR